MDPNFKIDTRRNAKYQPGQYITSAVMEQDKLECLFCIACCCKQELAEATYMDVYSNGVEIGRPMFFCCCKDYRTSIGQFRNYDDWVVFGDTAVKGEVCYPVPFCCVDKFGLCGEALVFRGKCLGGWTHGFGFHNQCNTPTWCCYIAMCMPISVMYGLAPGEADRIANIVNDLGAAHRVGRIAVEPRVAMAMGQQQSQAYGAVGGVPVGGVPPQPGQEAVYGYQQKTV